MSRKIIKKIVFFLMFSGAILGMYTFFAGVSDGDKRSDDYGGLVNNMYIGANAQKGQGPSFDDSGVSNNKEQGDRGKIGFDLGRLRLKIDEKNKEWQMKKPSGDKLGEETSEEDINVKDKKGNIIGQRLFPFGMSKDDQIKHRDHILPRDDNIVGEDILDNDNSNDENKEENDDFDVSNDNDLQDDDNDDEDMREDEALEAQPVDTKIHSVKTDAKEGEVETGDIRDDIRNMEETKGRVSEDTGFNPGFYKVAEEQNIIERDLNTGDVTPDVSIRDESGRVLGQKLYPFGMRAGENPNHEDSLSSQKLQQQRPRPGAIVAGDVKPDVSIRDESGRILGQKLYPFGMRAGENPNHEDSLSSQKLQQQRPRPGAIVAGDVKPDVSIRDGSGRVLGQKLYPFGMRHGDNLNHEDSLPSKTLQRQRPRPEAMNDKIRPDAAFFDDSGKVKEGSSEMDKLLDFQQRMGLHNSLSKHKFNINDPFNHHKALFRPLGANGMNPFLNKKDADEEDVGPPDDAFEGLNRESVWGDRGVKFIEPNPVLLNQLNDKKDRINSVNNNLVNQGIGQSGNAPLNQQQKRGQFMGLPNQNLPEAKQQSGQGMELPNKDLPEPKQQFGQFMGLQNKKLPEPKQQFGQFMGLQNKELPEPKQQFGQFMGNPNLNRGAASNYDLLAGQDPMPNVIGVQNSASNLNAVANARRTQMGSVNNYNGRYPLPNNNYNNANPLQINGIGDANINNRVDPRQSVTVTTVRQNLEQQIEKPDTNDRQLPLINKEVEVQNTNLEEEELFIEDLTQELTMNAECIPFPFPNGKAPLCVPDLGVNDEQEIESKLIETGTWEPESLKQFSEILFANPSMSVIDIGAGIGVYTIAAALMGRQVVAVEPLFINYRLLHKTALDNKVTKKIVLVAQGLDKESYLGHMLYSRETRDFNKVEIERIPQEDIRKDPANNVHVTTLDQLVKAVPFKKALLKIDVGGTMEAAILNAGSKFFESIDIPYIMTHWNHDIGITKKIQLASKFAALKYKPKLHWNGRYLDADVLKQSLDFIVWQKE